MKNIVQSKNKQINKQTKTQQQRTIQPTNQASEPGESTDQRKRLSLRTGASRHAEAARNLDLNKHAEKQP